MRSLIPGGLRLRVALLIGVLPLALLGVLWLFSSLAVQESIERTLQERLVLAQATADHLEYTLTQHLNRFQDIAFYPGVDLEDATLEPEQKALHETYFQSLPLFREGLFLTDVQGRVLWTEPYTTSLMGTIPFGEGGVSPLLETGVPRISDLFSLPGSGKAVLIAIAPVKSREGKIVGAAGGVLDPTGTELLSLLQPGEPSTAGYTLEVVDSRGMLLASTRRQNLLTSSDQAEVLGDLIRDRRTAVSRYRHIHPSGETGQTEVMAFAPLRSTLIPWGVSVIQPEAEALAPARRLQQRFLLSGILLVALAVALGWGTAQGIVRPVNALMRQARRIAGGDLSQPVPPLGGGEVAELGQAFEGMRQKLAQSWEKSQRWSQELEEKVQERTRDLEAARKLREELLHKLITAQEEERKRIARELHDETSQALAALAMDIDMLSQTPPASLQPRLQAMKGLVVKTLDGVHQMIFALRPSILDDLGLFPALRWYAESRLEPLGVKVQLIAAGRERRLPPSMEIALFRVVQEAITNTARHARAENVMVAVEFGDGTLMIEVEDDGVGFDPEALARSADSAQGLGLSGMRERVSLLGGTLSLWSEPGSGTRILVEVPLPQEVADAPSD